MNAARLLLFASLLALAACDWSYEKTTETTPPDASGSTRTTVSTSVRASSDRAAAVEAGEAHEPPPMFEGTFAPVSRTAQSITDEIEFDVDRLLFGFGHVYGTEVLRTAEPAEAAAFAKVATTPAETRFEVRKVTEELVNARAENGGLCEPEAATFVVLGAVPDVEGFTREVVMLAYKGAQAPTAASAEQSLCGTFLYGRPAE